MKIKVLLVFALLLVACSTKKQAVVNSCKTLNIINFSEYMKEDLYKKFEKEHNITIAYEIAESNEAMDLKVTSGVSHYDIIMPSDYLAEKWIQEDRVLPLDKSKLPNATGFYDNLMNPPFDNGNKYSIPYFWGTVGIIYNSEKIDKSLLEKEGWNILRNPQFANRVFAYDSERDGFMPAFKNLGYSMNTTNKTEIAEAMKWLTQFNETTHPIFVTDQVLDSMSNGEKDLAIVYSGDASLISKANDKMKYFMPNEGTNYWMDVMMISKQSKCSDLAHQFINYMLDEKVMEENTIEIGYTPPKVNVFEKLATTEYNGIASFKPVIRAKDEMLRYNPENKKTLSELWLKVKLKGE